MKVKRRYRYVGFKVLSPTPPGEEEIREGVWRSITDLFGAYGLSKIGPKMIEYDQAQSIGIIRCSHLHLPMLRASLASITSLRGNPTALFILRVSGTLKALRTALKELKKSLRTPSQGL